ncbi:MAG: HAD family hydrolase [Eubacteriales bacterium]|nr:HAD family hydrolase [Eubacteriales bacterium]
MMAKYHYYLFDLDGTITDSEMGITNSVKHALKKYGIEETDQDKLRKFVGPPLADSFMKYYGFTKEQAQKGIEYYREYYTNGGMFENEVYDGIPELLQKLKDAGKVLIVATSKPELFAKQILDHFDLSKYFDCIAGASMDESRVNKDEVIAYALDLYGVSEHKKEMVMIGDREHDIFGAKKNDLDSIGVLFGFGDLNELKAAGADYIVEHPLEIFDI